MVYSILFKKRDLMVRYVYSLFDIKEENIYENDVCYIIEGSTEKKEIKVMFIRSQKTLVIDPSRVAAFKIEETGDTYSHKVCDRCFKRLETEDFSNNRHKKDNVITKRPSCKSCRKIKDGKPISPADRRLWDKKKPPSLSIFTCPICEKNTVAGISKVVLDHCHKTGEVRGYLCESCNTGIGRFDDDPEIVKRAIFWLEKPAPK